MRQTNLERPLAAAPSGDLLRRAVQQAGELVRKEVELGRAEVRADIGREIAAGKGLGVAGVCALTTLNLILVALALAIAQAGLPAWAATLLVAAGVLVVGTIAGLVGWSKRVQKPLERTQRTLKEDVRWTKERLA